MVDFLLFDSCLVFGMIRLESVAKMKPAIGSCFADVILSSLVNTRVEDGANDMTGAMEIVQNAIQLKRLITAFIISHFSYLDEMIGVCFALYSWNYFYYSEIAALLTREKSFAISSIIHTILCRGETKRKIRIETTF